MFSLFSATYVVIVVDAHIKHIKGNEYFYKSPVYFLLSWFTAWTLALLVVLVPFGTFFSCSQKYNDLQCAYLY